jgi:hypothetical protein
MKIGAIRAQAACAWVQVQVQVQVHVRASTGEAIFRMDGLAQKKIRERLAHHHGTELFDWEIAG